MMREKLLLVALGLTACSTIPRPAERLATADNLAAAASFNNTSFGTAFPLWAYVRLSQSGSTRIRLYIEGDGFAYVTRSIPSHDPTPTDPVALRLAASDDSDAVVYMARPCQFNAATVKRCEPRFWTSGRYSEEMVNVFHDAINDLKKRYGVKEIEIVGFSGGATIASALAADREDIISLRTVAGNLDMEAFIAHHRINDLPSSVDPAKVSIPLQDLPQLHVVGGSDEIVPISILESFLSRQTMHPSGREKRIYLIPQMTHFGRWDEHWRSILRLPVE